MYIESYLWKIHYYYQFFTEKGFSYYFEFIKILGYLYYTLHGTIEYPLCPISSIYTK